MPTLAQAEPAIPDTPAGRIFSAWLAVINSGDIEQIRAFTSQHENNEEFVQRRLWTHRATGGLKLLRIEKSEPMTVIAYARDANTENPNKIVLTLQSTEPPKLDKVVLDPDVIPADLRPPKLSESEAIASLSAKMESLANADAFSGAILFTRHGKILFEKAYGFANRELRTPATVQNQFMVGSITKMFTAVAMLRLIEAGKASLEDTVGKYLPEFADETIRTKVTIRQLLTHTGGTGDMFSEEQLARRDSLREHRDYVAFFEKRPPAFEPGSKYEYSNFGYILLGRLIEIISGMSYYDFIDKEVFSPAGMQASDSLPESPPVATRAIGYMNYEGRLEPNARFLTYRGMAAGNAYSTVGDLWKFATALRDGRLISLSMLKKATTPHADSYGYGFGILGEGSLLRYGHNGGFPGVNSDMRIYPHSGYVLICLSNFDPFTAELPIKYFESRMPLN